MSKHCRPGTGYEGEGGCWNYWKCIKPIGFCAALCLHGISVNIAYQSFDSTKYIFLRLFHNFHKKKDMLDDSTKAR